MGILPKYISPFIPTEGITSGCRVANNTASSGFDAASRSLDLPVVPVAIPAPLPSHSATYDGTRFHETNWAQFYPAYYVRTEQGDNALWIADWHLEPRDRNTNLFILQGDIFWSPSRSSQATICPPPPIPEYSDSTVVKVPWHNVGEYGIENTTDVDSEIGGKHWAFHEFERDESYHVEPDDYPERSVTNIVYQDESSTNFVNTVDQLNHQAADATKTRQGDYISGFVFIPSGLPTDNPPPTEVEIYWTESESTAEHNHSEIYYEHHSYTDWWSYALDPQTYVSLAWDEVMRTNSIEPYGHEYTSHSLLSYSYTMGGVTSSFANPVQEDHYYKFREYDHLRKEKVDNGPWVTTIDETTIERPYSDYKTGVEHYLYFIPYKHCGVDASEADFATAKTTLLAMDYIVNYHMNRSGPDSDSDPDHANERPSDADDGINAMLFDWKTGQILAQKYLPDGILNGMTVSDLCLVYIHGVPKEATT